MEIKIKQPGILYLSQAQYDIRIAVKECTYPATHISRKAGVSYKTMTAIIYGANEPSNSTKAKILEAVNKLNKMDKLNKERNLHSIGLSLSSYLTQQVGA